MNIWNIIRFNAKFTYIIWTLTLTIWIMAALFMINYPLKYFDDKKYYIPAARALLRGASPAEVNWEHPPIAKYLIGISDYLLKDPTMLSKILGLLSFIVLYKLIMLMYGDKRLTLLTLTLLSLDTLYIYVFKTALLEVYATFFTILSVYLYLKYLNEQKWRYLLLFSASSGLAIGSKWSVVLVYPLLLLYLIVRTRTRPKMAITIATISILIALTVYTAGYTVYFMKGATIYDFIELQEKMYKYHSSWHRYTLPLIANSLTKMLLRIELWKAYSFTLTNPPINETSTTIIAKYVGIQAIFYIGLGNISWHLMMPALLISLRRTILNKEEITVLLMWIAATIPITLLMVVDWYIHIALPAYYILISRILSQNKKMMGILLILSAINLAMSIGFGIKLLRITFLRR